MELSDITTSALAYLGDSVLEVCVRTYLVAERGLPEGAEVSIGGSFQTLCKNEEGELVGKCQKTAQTLNLATSCDTIPCTWLRGGAKAQREGGGWMVEQTMESKLSSICTRPLEMVTGIRAGELREGDPERPSVIIRAKRGEETLWDIAKVCGSTVSSIQPSCQVAQPRL